MKQLIEGIELIGRTIDSGHSNPYYLIRTPDNRYIQLSELLYQTVAAMKQEHTIEGVALSVTKSHNKQIDARAIQYLIDAKLQPLGIINNSNNFRQTIQHNQNAPDMLHSLRFRITLLPVKTVNSLAKLHAPLISLWIMLPLLAGVVVFNIWIFAIHGLASGLNQTLFQPSIFLLILGLMLLSSLFHEIGHAAGALYGGAKPGRIGAGVYLIWPAFFTDISDVYRLGRDARLRSDFGGVYFNIVFTFFITIVYAITKFEPLLLIIFFQNLTIIHQLFPFLRLDGYFIISDLVGVHDLFMRIKPILKDTMLLRTSNATKDLKRWVKWIVTLWVLIMIPLLAIILGMMLIKAPVIISTAFASAQMQMSVLMENWQNKEYFDAAVRFIQLVLLFLPVLGICTILYLIGKPLVLKFNAKLDSYINEDKNIPLKFSD